MSSVSPSITTNYSPSTTELKPPQQPPQFNHVINHVAVSVPDIAAAVDWYTRVLGFRNLREIRTTSRADTPDAPVFKIYPANLHEVKVAWLAAGNGVGFEIFEFVDPPWERPAAASGFHYNLGGFFHIAVTAPDPEALLEKVVGAGGKKVGETVTVYDDRALYLQDPWGNVIEVLSCSFEQLMANRDAT